MPSARPRIISSGAMALTTSRTPTPSSSSPAPSLQPPPAGRGVGAVRENTGADFPCYISRVVTGLCMYSSAPVVVGLLSRRSPEGRRSRGAYQPVDRNHARRASFANSPSVL